MNSAAHDTIPCAWCGSRIPRSPETAPDSDGICAPCARVWGPEAAEAIRTYPAQRSVFAEDPAIFRAWAWGVEHARGVR